MAVLQITTPNGTRILDLPDGLITIGRRSSNDIVIEDDRASRVHCSLRPMPGGFLLKDLESRNGVKVDDQRINCEKLIQYGEAFVIGHTSMRIFEDTVPPVEMDDTLVEPSIEVPVAEVVEDDSLVGSPESGPERLLSEARRDLNNLRTAGTDPGFELDDLALLDRQGKPVHAGRMDEKTSPAVRTLRLLFYGAIRTRSTDMHFDPVRDSYQVRFRIDGKMLPVVLLPESIGKTVLSVVKVLADLDITGKHHIQDGGISVQGNRRVDCRVSLTPTMHGDKLVLRVLDTAGIPLQPWELGLPPLILRQIRAICNLDAGMMIVSGPTGSGKTTSLYTCLRSIDSKTRNVVTIEDPIEYHIDGITQIQINLDRGLNFSGLLKSILRQDPDVIMVGEIRDKETAQTAMQAAMTGHLVFSTLHAKDAIGSIFRLMDLGVEPYMIANSLSLCLAQRLVRKLCPHCRKAYQPKPSQLVKMGMQNERIAELYTHVGCRRCMNVGYWGRLAIFEMLNFNDDLRDALMTTKTIHDIRRAAGEWTYQSLTESGYRKVVEGVTTVEEIERVAARE
ncbi:MAG TPA: ATPase, T2SS/T4P/T4SS family [Phycisphaerae bacterium]|nr:ATPase, T2SS/T4P/T4SS family [Phycisphaerae bacterium]